MALAGLSMIVSAIVEINVEAAAKRLSRNEAIVRMLKRLRIDSEPRADDFDAIYAYALVEWGVFKPTPVLNFFRNDFIKNAFRQAFYKHDPTILQKEAEGIIDWNSETKKLGHIDYDPRLEFATFTAVFNDIVDRTRTPAEVKTDQSISALHERTDEILKRLATLPDRDAIRQELALLLSKGGLGAQEPYTTREMKEARADYLHEVIATLTPKRDVDNLGEYVEIPVEMAKSSGRDEEKRFYNSILSIPGMPAKFALVGEPGSGKTTTLRKLALDAAQKCMDDSAAPVPLVVELWKWGSEQSYLLPFLRSLIDSEPLYRMLTRIDSLDNLLADQRISFFLDGLDELSPRRIRILKDWVVKARINVIFTCRETEFTGIGKFDLPIIWIRPLTEENITLFAEKYLGEPEAEPFLTQVLEQVRETWDSEAHQLSRLAEIPFFLTLILANYEEDTWMQSPNRWSLLEHMVDRLWRADRVQLLLQEVGLSQYSETSAVTFLLAKLAFERSYGASIGREAFDLYVDKNMTKALVEAGLIQLGLDQIRLRHPLFADFFVANELMRFRDLRPLARTGAYSGALTVLAGRSEHMRSQVQDALLNAVVEDSPSVSIWPLGEIGDENALAPLLELYKRRDGRGFSSLLKVLARIANRLPDRDQSKQLVIDTIAEVLPRASDFDPENDLVMGDFTRQADYLLKVWGAAEAMAEIRSVQASRLLMNGLVQLCEHFGPSDWHHPMFNAVLSGFASCLSQHGRLSTPILLEAVESDDFHISRTASEALGRMRYSVPIGPLLHTLATHPSEVVRHEIAVKLGQLKNPAAVPHLISVLNDKGIWHRGRNIPIMNMQATYYYVADSAAYALAQIGTEECTSALHERLYNRDGSVTAELLIHRLEDGQDVDGDYSLRTQWARWILSMPEGLSLLLPRMGHLGVSTYRVDPVANALVERSVKRKESPVAELLGYLRQSADIESRKWVFYVLGSIGTLALADTLWKYATEEQESSLRSAAAGGLGILISEHLDHFRDLSTAVEFMLWTLDETESGSCIGVGLGLARIAAGCLREHPDVTEGIVGGLLQRVNGDDSKTARNALDALDGIHFGLASVRDINAETARFESVDLQGYMPASLLDKLRETVASSPTFHAKVADLSLDSGGHEGSKARLEDALDSFSTALKLKTENRPDWMAKFTEDDWIHVQCGDGEIYYGMGEALYGLRRWNDSLEKHLHAIEILGSAGLLCPRRKRKYASALFHAAMISVYHDDLVQALQLFSRCLEVSEDLKDTNLSLRALIGLQRTYSGLKDWPQVLEAGKRAASLADIAYDTYKERCLVRLYCYRAHASLGENETALRLTHDIETRAREYGLRDELAEVLLERAALKRKLQKTESVASDISSAAEIYESIQDWSSLADLLCRAAEAVYETDHERMLPLFERALACLERDQRSEDPEHLAYVLNQLALTYEGLGKQTEAEGSYRRALLAMEDQKISPVTASLLLNFGKHLYRTGQIDEGSSLAMQALAIQAELGMDTHEVEAALAEMSTNPEWKIPSPMVHQMLKAAFEALTSEPDTKEEVSQWLSDMIEFTDPNKWNAEAEFLKAVHTTLEGCEAILAEDSPYADAFNRFSAALESDRVFRGARAPLAPIVSAFCGADDWGASRAIVEEHPELLATEVEPVFEELIQIAQDRRLPHTEHALVRAREILRLCRDFGIDKVYWRLTHLPPIHETLNMLSSAKDPQSLQCVFSEHPELLSPEIDSELELEIRLARVDGEHEKETFLLFYQELLRDCRAGGIEAAYKKRAQSIEGMLAAVLEFVSADDWQASRVILSKHPELLMTEADAAFDAAIWAARSQNDSKMESTLSTHREVLRVCREIGIGEAFEHLAQLPQVTATALGELAAARDLQEARKVLDKYPELLSPLTNAFLDQTLPGILEQEDTGLVWNVAVIRGILDLCRIEGVDEAFRMMSRQPEVSSEVIMAFVASEDWTAARQVLEEHPDLMSPAADAEFETAARIAQVLGNHELQENLIMHQQLLRLCREVGVDAAFEHVKQESLLAALADNTIAVLTSSPARKDDWVSAIQQLTDEATEPQMLQLLRAVEMLLLSGYTDSLAEALEGPYLECWTQIVENLTPRTDEAAFERVLHNTIAVMTTHPAHRDEWLATIRRLSASSKERGVVENAELFDAIAKLLSGEDISSLTPKLEEPHISCWIKIVDALGAT